MKLSKDTTDVLLYVLFLASFSVILFSTRDSNAYFLRLKVENTFVSPQFADGTSYETITDISNIYEFVDRNILQTLNEMSPTSTNQANSSTTTLAIGSVSIRQIRSKFESCPIIDSLSEAFGKHCTSAFSEDSMKTGGSFCEAEFISEDDPDNPDSSYYSSQTKLSYPSSGYSITLDPNDVRSVNMSSTFSDCVFLDEATRAVIIKFFLYNVNLDLLVSNTFVVEQLASGDILSSFDIAVLPLLKTYRIMQGDAKTVHSAAVVVLEAIVYFIVVVYIVIEIIELKQTGWRGYFSSGWNLCEMLNLSLFIWVMTLGTYLYFVACPNVVSDLLTAVESPELHPANLATAAKVFQWMIDINSFNALISFLKLFKFVRSNKALTQIVDTIGRASYDILLLAFVIVLVLIGYGIAFTLTFGSYLSDYRDFGESVMSLFRATLGEFDLDQLREINSILGPALFVSYMVVMIYVILSMFLAIVDIAFDDVHSEVTAERESGKVEMEDDITKDFKMIMNILKGWFGKTMSSSSISSMQKYAGASADDGMKEEKKKDEENDVEKSVTDTVVDLKMKGNVVALKNGNGDDDEKKDDGKKEDVVVDESLDAAIRLSNDNQQHVNGKMSEKVCNAVVMELQAVRQSSANSLQIISSISASFKEKEDRKKETQKQMQQLLYGNHQEEDKKNEAK